MARGGAGWDEICDEIGAPEISRRDSGNSIECGVHERHDKERGKYRLGKRSRGDGITGAEHNANLTWLMSVDLS